MNDLTCDMRHIAGIQLLAMKVYGLQPTAPRLDCRNRPEAVVTHNRSRADEKIC